MGGEMGGKAGLVARTGGEMGGRLEEMGADLGTVFSSMGRGGGNERNGEACRRCGLEVRAARGGVEVISTCGNAIVETGMGAKVGT